MNDFLHYKVELGPVNFQNMGDVQMNKEVNKLDDIDTIDGNGQLYLALQDISMQNFTLLEITSHVKYNPFSNKSN